LIQFWTQTMGESRDCLQHAWKSFLDENNWQAEKIHKAVMQLVSNLEDGSGHHIYMDNLFVSMDIQAKGHGACGTCHVHKGMPACIEQIKSVNGKPNKTASTAGINVQGDSQAAFACNATNSLVATVWFDSGICHFMLSIHNPNVSVVKRRKTQEGTQGQHHCSSPNLCCQVQHQYGSNRLH
jgi:hypothetical protein